MPLRFEPPKQVARYALFIDHGNGRGFFKTYNDLGPLKNAYRRRNGRIARDNAKILEMVQGEWYTLHEVVAGTEYGNLPWVKEVNAGGWYDTRLVRKSQPMTRDEYADWRIKVERERIENRFDISLANL